MGVSSESLKTNLATSRNAFRVERVEIGNAAAKNDDIRVKHVNEVSQRPAKIVEESFHKLNGLRIAGIKILFDFAERFFDAEFFGITRLRSAAADVTSPRNRACRSSKAGRPA